MFREIGSLIEKLSASIGSDSFPQVFLKDNLVYCKMFKGIPIWRTYIYAELIRVPVSFIPRWFKSYKQFILPIFPIKDLGRLALFVL